MNLRGSCLTHETLVQKILEHGKHYSWVEEDIDYEFEYGDDILCGQIDAAAYRSSKNITLYEAKSSYTEKTYKKGTEQLDRAELMVRTTGELNGYPVESDATINKVYVSRQLIKRI